VRVKPLLLLDVDGVLNPYPETPAGYDEHDFFPEDDEPVRLAPVHGEWLRELVTSFEIVWATGWGEDANRFLCPHFGLETFPLLPLPPIPFDAAVKARAVRDFVGERPAAWIDDLITADDLAWAAARRAATLLVQVDHREGLTRAQVDRVLSWAAGLGRLG
jgi:hypothetical protein